MYGNKKERLTIENKLNQENNEKTVNGGAHFETGRIDSGFAPGLRSSDLPEGHRAYNILVTLGEDVVSLAMVMKVFENNKIFITHVESRSPSSEKHQRQLFLQLVCPQDIFDHVCSDVKQSPLIRNLTLLEEKELENKDYWFPRHISDLDQCILLNTYFEPDLDFDHPGYLDKKYRERRKEIADIAFLYRYGQEIPRVEYTDDENATWGHVYNKLKDLFRKHACKEHNRVFRVLEEECDFNETKIPQLEDVSNFLKRRTGFQLRPVAGLLTSRDFLASLAFRTFQCTQYVRHSAKPDHSFEPDCIHELLGHVPMFADPTFAQFAQELGLATLGASDEDIKKFATLFWFTVEYGLCREEGEIKVYGAAALTSYAELLNTMSNQVTVKPFDPPTTAVQEFKEDEYQTTLFVVDSFDDMMMKMRQFAASIQRDFHVDYDPYTCSVKVLDKKAGMDYVAESLKKNLDTLMQLKNCSSKTM